MSSLTDRGAEYFGRRNTADTQRVLLGRGRIAFVSPTRLWIYEERHGAGLPGRGMAVNLSEKRRADLLKALGA